MASLQTKSHWNLFPGNYHSKNEVYGRIEEPRRGNRKEVIVFFLCWLLVYALWLLHCCYYCNIALAPILTVLAFTRVESLDENFNKHFLIKCLSNASVINRGRHCFQLRLPYPPLHRWQPSSLIVSSSFLSVKTRPVKIIIISSITVVILLVFRKKNHLVKLWDICHIAFSFLCFLSGWAISWST